MCASIRIRWQWPRCIITIREYLYCTVSRHDIRPKASGKVICDRKFKVSVLRRSHTLASCLSQVMEPYRTFNSMCATWIFPNIFWTLQLLFIPKNNLDVFVCCDRRVRRRWQRHAALPIWPSHDLHQAEDHTATILFLAACKQSKHCISSSSTNYDETNYSSPVSMVACSVLLPRQILCTRKPAFASKLRQCRSVRSMPPMVIMFKSSQAISRAARNLSNNHVCDEKSRWSFVHCVGNPGEDLVASFVSPIVQAATDVINSSTC